MKKNTFTFGISALAIAALATSCSVTPPSFEGSSSSSVPVVTEKCGTRDAEPGEVVLNFWHAFNNENLTAIEYLTNQFNSENQGEICVNLTAQGNYDATLTNVDAAIKAGKLIPDLVTTYADHVAQYALSGKVIDLKSFIDDPEIGLTTADWEDIFEVYRDESTSYFGGHTYSLPLNKSTEVMFYNATFFNTWMEKYEAQGLKNPEDIDVTNPSTWWTWNDVKTVGEVVKTITLTEKNPTNQKPYNNVTFKVGEVDKTFSFPNGNPMLAYDSDANLFITLAHQSGGGYTSIDSEGAPVLQFMNEKTLTALEMYESLVEVDKVATIPSLIDESLRYASDAFVNQLIYLTVGSSAGSKYNDPQGTFELGVAPIPQMDLSNPQVIQQGTNITMLNSMKPNAEARQAAAWKYIKHVTSSAASTYFASNTGYMPIRKSATDSATYQAYLDRVNPKTGRPVAASQADTVGSQQVFAYFYDPAFPSSSAVRNAVGGKLTEALKSSSYTIRVAAKDAYDSVK